MPYFCKEKATFSIPIPGSKPLNWKFLYLQSWRNLFHFIGLPKVGQI